MPQQRLHAPDRRLQPDGQHSVEDLLGHLLDRIVTDPHGGVDHPVDPLGRRGEAGGGRLEARAGRQVPRQRLGAAAPAADGLHHLLAGRRIDVGDPDRRAGGGQQLRGPPAEAAAAAGDQDRPVLQIERHRLYPLPALTRLFSHAIG